MTLKDSEAGDTMVGLTIQFPQSYNKVERCTFEWAVTQSAEFEWLAQLTNEKKTNVEHSRASIGDRILN